MRVSLSSSLYKVGKNRYLRHQKFTIKKDAIQWSSKKDFSALIKASETYETLLCSQGFQAKRESLFQCGMIQQRFYKVDCITLWYFAFW